MKKAIEYFVYIMSNQNITLFYTGQTSNLFRRSWQHKNEFFENAFTKKYNINRLLYFEKQPDLQEALKREKQIKNWSKIKKINLIKKLNPEFKDLFEEFWKLMF